MPLQDRKQRQFAHREREILAAALALCSTPDWERVTVNQIARHAEVGKGTVYKHFASKDELLFRLMMDFYRGLLDVLREQIPPGSAIEQLRAAVARALRYHADHKEYRYVVAYCERIDFKERADARWKEDFLELDRAFMGWASPILAAGIEQGLIEPRPLEQLMLGISAAFHGAVGMIWASKEWCPLGDDDSVIAAVTDFVMVALAGRCAGPPGQPNAPSSTESSPSPCNVP
jgi:AcrR family transcriptional regulator